MKQLKYLFFIIIAIYIFSSCHKNEDESGCINKELVFKKHWEVQLDDYFNFGKSKWIDMNNDIALLTHNGSDAILNIFNKESGKLINTHIIESSFNDHIYTYNDLIIYDRLGSIYKYDPSTSEVKEIEIKGSINYKISITGNKILIAESGFSDTISRILMIDIDNMKYDTLLEEVHPTTGDYYVFSDPYLFISSAGDSILYYEYYKNNTSSPKDIVIYNLVTEKKNQLRDAKRNVSDFRLKDDRLYAIDISDFYELDPYTLKNKWSVKYNNIIYPRYRYDFVAGNVFIESESDIASIDLTSQKVKWENHLSFFTQQNYNSANDVINMNKRIYYTFDDGYKYIDIETGEVSPMICVVPKELNYISSFSNYNELFGITYDKKLVKYTEE